MRSPGAFFRRWFGRQTSLPEVNSVALMADPLSHSTDPPGEALQEEPLEDLDLPRVMPIEESIDLHTFSPKETASVVEEYLIEAQRRGFGREGLTWLLAWLASELSVTRCAATIDVRNEASIALAQAAGMTWIETRRADEPEDGDEHLFETTSP